MEQSEADPTSPKFKPQRPPLKFRIPAGTPQRQCRGCGRDIWWIVTGNGKKMPVNEDGVSHFATCERSADFRRPR